MAGPQAARFVLASASQARLTALRRVGIATEVQVSQVDEAAALAAVEAVSGPLHPADVALALAGPSPTTSPSAPRVRRTRWSSGATRCSRLDGEVHGKPARPSSAQRWRRMRGRSGTLHTGHWLVDTRRPEVRRHPGQRGFDLVDARPLRRAHRRRDRALCVATGEPLHVARAFTIDGLGGAFVSGVEGDHHGVVGLSLPLLRLLLADLGVAWFDLARPTA